MHCDSGCSKWSQTRSWMLFPPFTHTGFSCVVVHWLMSPLPWKGLTPLPISVLFFIYFLSLTQISRWKPANLFSFNAPAFHPIYAATFLLSFFQHMIIEGRTFDSSVGLLLNNSALSHHTGIVHFWTRDSVVKTCTLVWSHSCTWPWGTLVPYQCPSCRCIQAWDQKGQGELGRDVTMRCSYKGENGQCPERFTAEKPSIAYKTFKLLEGVWVALGLETSDFL
jgi:hypothetical protein